MVRIICTVLTLFVTGTSALIVQADDHMQVPDYGGVEVFGCDFGEGKDMTICSKWPKNGTGGRVKITSSLTLVTYCNPIITMG